MKRILPMAVVLTMFASVAQAGRWQYCGRGVYAGDNYYYHAYKVCGCWKYDRLCAIADCPQPGTPDFWTRMAELNVKADELQSEADYVKSRWPGRYRAADVQTTGYSVLQQGYVQGGTTLQATGAYIAPVDVNGIIHEAQRLQELAGVNSSQANAQVNTIVNSAVEGNSASARIIAAGQVAAATIAASMPPPQTNTTVFQSRSIASGPSVPTTASFATVQPSGDAVALLSHGLLVQQCAACHNPTKHAGNLDVTGDLSTLATVRDEIERRIRLPALDKDHMPKNRAELSAAIVNGILAGVPTQTFAAHHGDTPPIPQQPQGDQPPLPPQDGTPPAPQN